MYVYVSERSFPIGLHTSTTVSDTFELVDRSHWERACRLQRASEKNFLGAHLFTNTTRDIDYHV